MVVPDGDEGVPAALQSDGVRQPVEAAPHVNSHGGLRAWVGPQGSQYLKGELQSSPGLRLTAGHRVIVHSVLVRDEVVLGCPASTGTTWSGQEELSTTVSNYDLPFKLRFANRNI